MALTEEQKTNLDKILKTREGKKATKALVEAMASSFVRNGLIEAKGKTKDELRKAFIDKYIELSKENVEFSYVIDHTQTLLRTAEKYQLEEKYDYSTLFFATYIEHKINHFITIALEKKNTNPDIIKEILKEVPLRGKASWLLKILGLPSLAPHHIRFITTLANIRNQFVHYKWTSKSTDHSQETLNAIINIRKTVAYLRRYEAKYIFMGIKKRQLKIG